MAERKPISKKIRFEVFKRDHFTCQYCGRMSPDVVLEVDHIKPVAKGGTNDIMNLVTSCGECNRGKRDIELSDDSAIKKQQKQLKELAKREEQLTMMLEWRENLKKTNEKEAKIIKKAIIVAGNYRDPCCDLTTKAMQLLAQFNAVEILEAIDISFARYYTGSKESYDKALEKIGGVCYNRKKQASVSKRYFNQLNEECKKRFNMIPLHGDTPEIILHRIADALQTQWDFESIMKDMSRRNDWEDFVLGNYDTERYWYGIY